MVLTGEEAWEGRSCLGVVLCGQDGTVHTNTSLALTPAQATSGEFHSVSWARDTGCNYLLVNCKYDWWWYDKECCVLDGHVQVVNV